MGIIGLIDFGWTLDFNFYFSFQDYISFLTEDFLVIDCFVQDINEDILVVKIIFTTILPIILSLFMLFIWVGLFVYFTFYQKVNEQGGKFYSRNTFRENENYHPCRSFYTLSRDFKEILLTHELFRA